MHGEHDMKIPFAWLPASWGLKGKSREIAQAEYELSGYELEVKLAQINHGDDANKLKGELLDIDLRHKKIDRYTYDIELASVGKSEVDAELAKLDVDLSHGRITANEHERKRADLKGEPWMAMPKIGWDPINPSKTYFELDYNEYFISFLRENGYLGSDEDCINRWLNDVCVSVLDDMNQPEPEMITPIRKIRLPDGKTEHS
jgi:hypothetical protein